MKKLILLFTIMLFTVSLVFAQWTIDEGFEGGAIPAGWTTSAWGVYSTAGYPHTGTYLAASGMGNDWLITPQVYIQSGDSFIFWTRAWMGTEGFNVKLSTTGNATGDFTTTLGTYTGVGETWVEYSYDLSAYTGNIYLAIEVVSGGDYVLALDDVLVGQDAPSCPAPSNLNATNILTTQADFGWTENGSATIWNIEVGAPGFTPGTSTYIQAYTGITSNPYTGIGLTASSNYDFYVQADCGTRETSNWAGPEAFSTPSLPSGLSAGDISFTAMNADGDDDFAIVALADIPANVIFYFTDNEPNADGSGFADFNEGTLEWATGGAVISAGTIVVFTDTDSGTNPLFGASVGTLSVPSFDAGMNLSSSGDALYTVEGSPEFDGITTWLAGIQNEANNQGANFTATGLTVGTTFINYYTTGSPDGGYYSGDRNTQSSFSDYLPLLGDNSNWTIESSNGENILPISTSAFSTFSGPDNPAGFAAVPVSHSEIDLDWTQNGSSDNVLVAWSSDGTFGTPINGSTYSNGDPITGGGAVLYYGSALHYDHTGLTDYTPYFYRAWSYDGSEYSFGVTDNATTLCIPYTADFSDNFDSETPPDLPNCWSYLEISASTFGYVSTSTTSSYSLPNNVRMYKIDAADDLLLITPQLGDLTSQSNQIRFMGRASGWAQDLIIGTMSDPTDETTFTAFETIPITIFNVYEEYTVMFDETYTLTDEYIAFKHGATINYSYLNIDDFIYEAIPSGPAPIDWGAGMTGSVDVGVPSAPGSGYGTGLLNEDLLANPANVGLYFTLTIDDGAPVDVTICLDLTTLGYSPLNLAYWVNGDWVYYPVPPPIVWTGDCVTFTLDPTVTRGGRADVDIPIVFSSVDGPLPVTLTNFTAQFINDNLTILWTTQSECNNLGWNIYRGETENALENNTTFCINNSGLIPGAGTTSEPTDYQFTDEYDVTVGQTYWYWLETVDGGGNTDTYGPATLTVPEEEPIPQLPLNTFLCSNYPNPFNPETKIEFSIKEGENGSLSIYNTKGQLLETRHYEAGEHKLTWDAIQYGSGIYFYKLETQSYTETKKMIMLK